MKPLPREYLGLIRAFSKAFTRINFHADRYRYRARQVSDDEKRAPWPHLLSIYPDFDEYQARTDRDIPVFRGERIDDVRAS